MIKVKSKIINSIYIFICVIPFVIFIREFFFIDGFSKIIDGSFWDALILSVILGLVSTALSFCIGIIPAYYIARNENCISKLLNGLIFVPFFFPVISTVTVFSIIFNFEIFKNFKILYSVKAILIANVFYNSPIFVKYIGDGLGKIPRDLIESATIDGVSGIKRFFTIDIPLVLPQILRGGLLIFTYCFLSFGIVMSLGGIRFTTLEVKIVSAFMGGSKFSYGIFYGFVQLLILGFINIPRLMVTEISLSNDRKIGKTNFFFKLFSLIYLILEYGIVLSSFVFSFFNYYIGKFSLKYYKLIFSSEFNGEYPVITSIINSIKISFVVGLIVIFFSYLLIKNYNKFTEILMFSYIGVSGGFLGIALYYLNISFNIPIYVIVIVGQIITAIPIGYSFMYQHIKKFPKELLENAEIDCNNKLEKFIYVEFPNLKNIFLSAFLQVFAIIFGEFTLVYTMQIEDILPLSSLVNYSMVANKKYLESAAFTTIIIMIIGILFIIGEFLKKKEE